MPIAVFTNETKRFDLITLPEAYVIIRRMNYGESLKRQTMVSKIYMAQAEGTRDMRGEVDLQPDRVAIWEFANLIVEHNLTDEHNTPLNFKNPMDVIRLNGPVGNEIGKYIDEFTGADEGPEVKNS
jgi:hypothetical protein